MSRLHALALLLAASIPAAGTTHAVEPATAAPAEGAASESPAPLASEPETSRPAHREEIVVTATRTAVSVRDVPASVSVVDRAQIEASHALRAEELLLGLPGVDGAEPMAGGWPAQPRLRGLPGTFAGSSTQVLVDGLPVEPILISNRQAWLLVPPQDLERIEVVRGPASALYGPSAAGGVVNLITRTGRGTPFAELSAGYGSHASYRTAFTAGGSAGEKVDVLLGATDHRTSGYRPWPTTPARYANNYPPPASLYDLDGRDSTDRSFQGKVGVRPTDRHDLSAAFRYFEIDGAWLGGHPNYRWNRQGGTLDLGWRWRPADAVEVKARAQATQYENRVRNDSNAYNGDGVLDLIAVDREWEEAWRGDLQADLQPFAGNTLTAGVAVEQGSLRYRGFDNLGVENGSTDGESLVAAAYLQDQHRLGERLVLQAGARFDQYRLFGDTRSGVDYPSSTDDVFTYRGGARFHASGATSLYASVGSAYLPALNNLKFRRAGGSWLNNPDLRPERSTSYEVGVDQSLGRGAKCSLALFHTRYRDMITAVSVATQRQYQNVADVKVLGIEASAEARLLDSLRLFAAYTYSDSRIGKDPSSPATEGKHPVYTPVHKASAGVTYADRRFIDATLAARYVGAQYSAATNTAASLMKSYATVDARLSRSIAAGSPLREVVLALSASNLLDAHYVVWADDLADGRTFWLDATLKF